MCAGFPQTGQARVGRRAGQDRKAGVRPRAFECDDSVQRLTSGALAAVARISDVAEPTTQPLEQQLEEIGTRLAWVRDYL
jgi:hypothetical protein